jgi:DNA-binding transcriptional MerR regulator
MFKIGEFSRFSQVTVKTLRHYDKIGLLKPAEVDRFTGYRYYSASQLPRLNRILALKDLGLSLDQIAQLLEGDLSPDQIRGMLRLKQVEIQQQMQEEQVRLARVEWRLKQIEREENHEESHPYRNLGLACADRCRWRLFLVHYGKTFV